MARPDDSGIIIMEVGRLRTEKLSELPGLSSRLSNSSLKLPRIILFKSPFEGSVSTISLVTPQSVKAARSGLGGEAGQSLTQHPRRADHYPGVSILPLRLRRFQVVRTRCSLDALVSPACFPFPRWLCSSNAAYLCRNP